MTQINDLFRFKDDCDCGWKVASAEMDCSNTGSHRDQSRSRAIPITAASVDYMRQHLDQPLRISTLSARAGVSVSHFFCLFKSATGYTPLNFFIRLRIHRAGELLRDENLSVKETAARLGYDDPFYFSRIFKSVTGVAPSSYRHFILEHIGRNQPVQVSFQEGGHHFAETANDSYR